jgi:NADH-quinone oxidoreductase subunit H
MGIDVAIAAGKVVFIILLAVQVVAFGGFCERKISALIQDRIGANRASILGFAGMGLINTLVADPIKWLLKEDVQLVGTDRLLHFWAPVLSLVMALVPFAVVPFGDVLYVAGREVSLQAAPLDVGVLYVLAMVSLGVYGVVLGGWASNNRWSLLGSVRGSAQMISYEIAMGLALVGAVLVYNTLDLQEIARAQGTYLLHGWVPAWGILYQPLGFLLFFVGGVAESKRTPFDLPESESELIAGYFTEYSGAKHFMFFMADFVEVVLVAALVTTLYFGGWQVPWLARDGFHLPWGATVALPALVVTLLGVVAFSVKLLFFTILQIVVRWTLPRFRYDQLMRLGWKGLLPVALANVVATAALVLWLGSAPA